MNLEDMKAELHISTDLSPTGFSGVTAGRNKKLTVVKENKHIALGVKITIKQIQGLAESLTWRDYPFPYENSSEIRVSERFQNKWRENLNELLSYVERIK